MVSVRFRVMVRVRVVIHGVIVTVVYCTSLRQKLVSLLRDLTLWRGYNLYQKLSFTSSNIFVNNRFSLIVSIVSQ